MTQFGFARWFQKREEAFTCCEISCTRFGGCKHPILNSPQDFRPAKIFTGGSMQSKIVVAVITGALAFTAWPANSAQTTASPAGRTTNQSANQQNNGQQTSAPQSVDDARRDEEARRRQVADDRARSDERSSEAPREGGTITLPADSRISVRIADAIDSNHNHDGDMFTGIVDPSVMIHDNVVIPRGTEAHVRLANRKKGGHIHGKAKISLELVSLVVNGRRLEVESDLHSKDKGTLAAKGKAEKDSATHMGSASGLAGPAGAAAGPVIGVFTAAKVEVKANTRVDFVLAEPFTFEKPPVNGVQAAQ
jgi:hypothetical protein